MSRKSLNFVANQVEQSPDGRFRDGYNRSSAGKPAPSDSQGLKFNA